MNKILVYLYSTSMVFWHGLCRILQEVAHAHAMSHMPIIETILRLALPVPIGTQEHVFHLANPRSLGSSAKLKGIEGTVWVWAKIWVPKNGLLIHVKTC